MESLTKCASVVLTKDIEQYSLKEQSVVESVCFLCYATLVHSPSKFTVVNLTRLFSRGD